MAQRNFKNLERNKYISGLYSSSEPESLRFIKNSIKEHNLSQINLSFNEAKIIQILIKTSNTKTIVEFGTHAGYSATSMALALPDDGKIFTFEKDPKTAEIAKNNFTKFGLDNKIEIIVGDAHENLNNPSSLPKNLFLKAIDMVFIDAEKQGYTKYLEWAYNNVRKGGLIIADNTFLFDAVFDGEIAKTTKQNLVTAMKEFNLAFSDSSKFESIILPTDDGLSVAIRK